MATTFPSSSAQDQPRYSKGPTVRRPRISGRLIGPRTVPENVAGDFKASGKDSEDPERGLASQRHSSKSAVVTSMARLDCDSPIVPLVAREEWGVWSSAPSRLSSGPEENVAVPRANPDKGSKPRAFSCGLNTRSNFEDALRNVPRQLASTVPSTWAARGRCERIDSLPETAPRAWVRSRW